jgi:hypothetical protein
VRLGTNDATDGPWKRFKPLISDGSTAHVAHTVRSLRDLLARPFDVGLHRQHLLVRRYARELLRGRRRRVAGALSELHGRARIQRHGDRRDLGLDLGRRGCEHRGDRVSVGGHAPGQLVSVMTKSTFDSGK